MTETREEFPLDVLFVGGGPASLAGAIRLAQLVAQRNEAIKKGSAAGPEIALEIGVIEKAREFGHHGISGAVLNPLAMAELLPDYLERGCPVARKVGKDSFYLLTPNASFKVPDFLVPPDNHNKGFYTLSLQRLTKWMAEIAEGMGIYLFPATTGVEILYEGDRVAGVRTGDKGLEKGGGRKPNFEPGLDIKARLTIFGEGPYGTLSEDLILRHRLREGRNPQIYSLGVKEVIKVPKTPGEGLVLHTLGFPMRPDQFGGGFFYEMDEETWSIGFVASLSWKDPLFDCHAALQALKKHPLIQSFIRGGEVLSYGAKTIPEGGYWSVPRPYVAGAMLIGDSAGLVNVKQIKGIHYAMKSGMLAAETAFEALQAGDVSEKALAVYETRLKDSWVMKSLWSDRNFRIAFEKGLYRGLMATGLHRVTGGGSRTRTTLHPDYEAWQSVATAHHEIPEPAGFDPGVIVDKLTDASSRALSTARINPRTSGLWTPTSARRCASPGSAPLPAPASAPPRCTSWSRTRRDSASRSTSAIACTARPASSPTRSTS